MDNLKASMHFLVTLLNLYSKRAKYIFVERAKRACIAVNSKQSH